MSERVIPCVLEHDDIGLFFQLLAQVKIGPLDEGFEGACQRMSRAKRNFLAQSELLQSTGNEVESVDQEP